MKNLQYFETKLEELKAQLEDEMKLLIKRGSEPMKESVGELSGYDNHPSDLGAETYEREKDIGLKDNTKILLMKVNHALDKIKKGTYGICERCGKPIKPERLELVPYSTLCIECKKAEEERGNRRSRPLEETFFGNSFGRSFLDGTDSNEYDGEDAWQDVARYGTSNTPQDEPGALDYTETYTDGNEKRGVVGREDMIIDEEDIDEDDKNEMGN